MGGVVAVTDQVRRLTIVDLPAVPLVVVTPTEGSDQVDDRVLQLARAEAGRSGWRLGEYLGLVDDPDARVRFHAFAPIVPVTLAAGVVPAEAVEHLGADMAERMNR